MSQEWCSHGILWTNECRQCSLIWHKARLECAQEDVARHKKAIAKLEQESK